MHNSLRKRLEGFWRFPVSVMRGFSLTGVLGEGSGEPSGAKLRSYDEDSWDEDFDCFGHPAVQEGRCSDGSTSYAPGGSPDADASTQHTATVTGLCAGVSHSFTVKAVVNSSYESPASAPAAAVPRMVATPLNLRKSDATANSVSITWDRVEWESAGSLSYEVRRDGGSPVSKSGSTLSHTFTELTADTNYKFEARAVVTRNDKTNAYSDWAEISLSTLPSPPATPTRLRVTATGTANVTLEWNYASRATSYEVRYKPVGTTTYSSATSIRTISNISGLDSWVLYEFQVRAINTGGESAWSTKTTKRTSERVTGRMQVLRFSHFSTDHDLLFAFLTEERVRIYAGTSKKFKDLTPSWTTIGEIVRTTTTPSQRLGQIEARKFSGRSSIKVDICFLPSGSKKRICPERRFLHYSIVALNKWYNSSELSFIVDSSATVASGVSGSSDDSSQDPLAEALPPGVDLGPFDLAEGRLEQSQEAGALASVQGLDGELPEDLEGGFQSE